MRVTSGSSGNLPTMSTRGGRPSDYTPEEDAIILRYKGTEEVNAALVEAGFPERTQAAIWSRRKHLRNGGATDLDAEVLDADEEVALLLARRKRLQRLVADTEARLSVLREEIQDLNTRLHSLIDD